MFIEIGDSTELEQMILCPFNGDFDHLLMNGSNFWKMFLFQLTIVKIPIDYNYHHLQL